MKNIVSKYTFQHTVYLLENLKKYQMRENLLKYKSCYRQTKFK